MTLEEDLLNYSLYFKNLPQQTALMEEGGIQFFAVSAAGGVVKTGRMTLNAVKLISYTKHSDVCVY